MAALFDYQQFSKDEMWSGWRSATTGVGLVGECWFKQVMAKFGPEVARELHVGVWVNPGSVVEIGKEVKIGPPTDKRMAVEEATEAKKWLDFRGDNVATLAKVLPCMLGTPGHIDYEIELKNDNHGIFTVKKCRWMDWFESQDWNEAMPEMAAEWITHICWEIEAPGFAMAAHYVNPKIKTIPLKLPPRETSSEFPCQFEYILEV